MALLALNYAIGFADPAPSCECDHCGRGVSDEMLFLQFVFAAVGFHGRVHWWVWMNIFRCFWGPHTDQEVVHWWA